jgi:hypothetical protein
MIDLSNIGASCASSSPPADSIIFTPPSVCHNNAYGMGLKEEELGGMK